jgi:lactoylglutathione lyase
MKINMIGIFVSDLKNMVKFYNEILGFEIDWDGNPPYAEFKEKGVRFAFFERKMLPDLLGQEPTYPSGLNGTFEIAIDLPRFEDVDTFFDTVVKKGAKQIYGPRDEPWGMRSSAISDPEGNIIEIGSWNKGS